MGDELGTPLVRGKARLLSSGSAERIGHAEALVGRLLCGKWRTDALLNSGGTSWVYSGTHRNGKRVAIKVLRPEVSADARTRRRFLREGYLANRVGHRGAVCVLDDDTEKGIVFLVMELLEGTNLERLSRDGAREAGEVAFLADALLDILAAAHASGIVHRDVKPGNVLWTTSGEIKLLDFGIARLLEPSTAVGHTRNGAVLGTPGFMAPEQARARWGAVDARTDIWAVGATMFRLLTGRLVHDGVSGQEAVIAAATLPVSPLKTVRADVPDSLAELVDRALRFEAGQRWQSAREMQAAVRAVRSELPPYEWHGLSVAGGASRERTVDAVYDTPTTSFFEQSQLRVSRGQARHVRRARPIVPFVFAVLVAGAPLVAHLRARTDAAKEAAPVDGRSPSKSVGEAARPGGAIAGETTPGVASETPAPANRAPRAAAMVQVKAPATTPPAQRSVTHPVVRGVPPGRNVEPTSDRAPASAPARLEEFLNERR
jgi:predicted Ser/Thr protein kinase